MAKTETEFMSKNAYAKYLGVNEKAIRLAVNDGKIKKGWDAGKQKIIKHLADKEYGFLHQSPKPSAGVSKAKVIEKLSVVKRHDKVSKLGTNFGAKNDNSELRTLSEQSNSEDAEEAEQVIADLSNMETAELLKLLPITADMDYKSALTANEIIEAALKKKKLQELEDILVRKDKVENTLYAFGSQLRKALLAIPARVIDDIMAADNKVEGMNLLVAELTETLDTYSNIETIKLSNKN